MSRKKTSLSLNAITVRYILAGSLLVIILGMGAGFHFAYTMLHDVASESAQKQAEAQSVDSRVNDLIILQRELEKYKLSAEKAAKIAAEAKSYQYQNQVIEDINFYAQQAGISIDSFAFKEEDTKKTPPKTASPSPGSSSAAPAPQTPSTSATALKSTQVTIQLSRSVRYENLLHFLHLIEKNLTRMQIANLVLSRGEDSATVSSQVLTLEVYIR